MQGKGKPDKDEKQKTTGDRSQQESKKGETRKQYFKKLAYKPYHLRRLNEGTREIWEGFD